MPTMKEVAAAAGVSVATVSRVLNHDPKVSPETRDRVMEVVRRTGYTPNVLGGTCAGKTPTGSWC